MLSVNVSYVLGSRNEAPRIRSNWEFGFHEPKIDSNGSLSKFRLCHCSSESANSKSHYVFHSSHAGHTSMAAFLALDWVSSRSDKNDVGPTDFLSTASTNDQATIESINFLSFTGTCRKEYKKGLIPKSSNSRTRAPSKAIIHRKEQSEA
jgi:hypothetical protein